jgi:hypothetical protein
MPPFRYRDHAFQDPYVGDITRLMGAGPEAEARSIREVGNIRAQESQQKGAIRSNLAQGLGQTVNQGYAAYRDAKADEMWAGFLSKIAAPSDFDRGQEGSFYTDPNIEVPGLSAPPLTPQITTSETGTVALAETPETGEEFFMPEARDTLTQTFEGPTTTQTLPYEGAPQPTVVPETLGVLGDMTGADKKPYEPYRGQFFQNVTDHGLHDIESLRVEAARAGMSGDQMARKIAESTAHNQSVTAFTTQNRAFEMSDLQIRQEGLLATILGNDPHPTDQLRATLVRALGPTKGLEIFGIYSDSYKALQEIQQNNFENAGPKLRAILAAVQLTGNPVVQGELLDGVLNIFEEAGTPMPPEFRGKTVQEWETIVNRAYPEEAPTTQWGYERQLQADLANGVPGAKAAWENYLQSRTDVTQATQRATAPQNSGRALTARLTYEKELKDLTNLYRTFQADPITTPQFSDGVEVTEEEYLRRVDALWDTLQTSLQAIEGSAEGIQALNPPRPGERIDAERDAQRTALTTQIAQLEQQINKIATPPERGFLRSVFFGATLPGRLADRLRGWSGDDSTRQQLVADLDTARAKLEALGGNTGLLNPEGFNLPSRGVNP